MELKYLFLWLMFLAEHCCGYPIEHYDCGAKGGKCGIECHLARGITLAGYYFLPVSDCVLEYLNYSQVPQDETVIDLSGKSITLNHLPQSLYGVNYNKIKTLNVSNNVFHYYSNQRFRATSLPTFINQFTNLTALDLSSISKHGIDFHNWLGSRDLNSAWLKTSALKYLDISGNQNRWTLGRNAFQSMVNLKQLKMSSCCDGIPENPDFFRDLNSLESLDISDNTWSRPPKTVLFPMRNLKHLDMSRSNAVVDTSILFAALPNLESIALAHFSEAVLNVSEFRFSSNKLCKVSLNGNKLSGLDGRIGFLGMPNSSALEYLDLSDVKVISLKENENTSFLQNLIGLKFLNISGSENLVRHLNSTLLQNTTNLKTLDMGHLELWERKRNNDSNIFKTLHNLKHLLMPNVTINGQDLNENYHNGSWLPTLSFVDLQGAVCKHCNLWSLLGKCQNLSQIDLSLSQDFNMNFTTFNIKLPKLKSLNLFKGSFPVVDFSGLENLEILNISGIHAKHVKLSGLPKLEFLNFSGLFDSFGQSRRNDFQSKMDVLELSDLQNLNWVDFSQIGVNKVILQNLPKLEAIHSSKSSIGLMDLENLESLKILNLSNSHPIDLTLNNLPSFPELDLSNSLSEMNKVVIRNLPKLEKLNLFNVSVKVIKLENLESLTFVNFSQIKNTKMGLINLPMLNELHLSDSKLQKIWTSNVTNVTNLDLSFITDRKVINQLDIGQFKNLASLNFSSCELLEVPGNLIGLSFLRSLDLSRNFLTALPQRFLPAAGECKLVTLDLSNNFLEVIPLETISSMIDPYIPWTVNLENNLLNCSDCRNSWMTLEKYSGNAEDAVCQTPFEKYHIRVEDVEICGDEGE